MKKINIKNYKLIIILFLFQSIESKKLIITSDTEIIGLSTSSLNQSATSGNSMITIDTSGRYYLKNNFNPTAVNTNVTCIKITSSNVILDMNYNSIVQNDNNSGFIAIEIATGLSNITIANGTISTINGTGIKINSNCHDIDISSMKINKCKNLGLDISSSNNIKISNIVITNCDGSSNATDGAVAMKLNTCTNINIINSKFNNNQAATGVNCTTVYLVSSENCKFTNCSSSLNKGVITYGFRLTTNCKSCLFENTKAKDNQSTGGICYGFYIDSSNENKFKECICASNNTTFTTATSVHGFYLSSSNRNIFINCESFGQNASTSSGGNAFGYYSTGGTSNSFITSSAIGNIAGTTSSSVAAGFALRSNETLSMIQGCKSFANDGNTGEGYGIMLGSGSDSVTNNSIIENLLYYNRGTAKKYGYKDFATNTTTYLAKNISVGQKKISPGLTNPTDNGYGNYMWKFTDGVGHPASNLVSEPTNLAGLTNISSTQSFINISVDDN